MDGMVRTEELQAVDLAPMFPEWDHAMATRSGRIVTVKLTRGGAITGMTIQLDIEQIYQSLDKLRGLGPQTKPR